jgi:hypothetical protein
MSQKWSYFRFTTPQQRKLLFEIWEENGSVTEACRKAHVGRATFYYWKPRFDEKGYPGLEEFESRVAHKLNRKSESIEQGVIAMRRQHPDWGKFRIADEMARKPSLGLLLFVLCLFNFAFNGINSISSLFTIQKFAA